MLEQSPGCGLEIYFPHCAKESVQQLSFQIYMSDLIANSIQCENENSHSYKLLIVKLKQEKLAGWDTWGASFFPMVKEKVLYDRTFDIVFN